jgi:hypothetical protein
MQAQRSGPMHLPPFLHGSKHMGSVQNSPVYPAVQTHLPSVQVPPFMQMARQDLPSAPVRLMERLQVVDFCPFSQRHMLGWTHLPAPHDLEQTGTMHKPKMLCLVQPGQQYVLYLALHTLGPPGVKGWSEFSESDAWWFRLYLLGSASPTETTHKKKTHRRALDFPSMLRGAINPSFGGVWMNT